MQRNDVFKAVEKAQLRPEEFAWQSEGDDDRLTHSASRGYFVFEGAAGNYGVRYRAADGPVEERQQLTWLRLMSSVEIWLWSIKADRDTPDLWGEVSQNGEVLGPRAAESVDNTPFDAAERAAISEQLRKIQEYVRKSYALSADESRALDERIAYIEGSSGRLGRIDWRNATAGAMLGALVAAVLPPDAVRDFLQMLFEGVGHLYSLLPG